MPTLYRYATTNDLPTYNYVTSRTAVTKSVNPQVNTIITKFTVSKTGYYIFLPTMRSATSSAIAIAFKIDSGSSLTYPVIAYGDSVCEYRQGQSTGSGSSIVQLNAGTTYNIWCRANSSVTFDDVTWFTLHYLGNR